MKDCIFCKIASGKIPSEKIYENDKFYSIFDIKPSVKGHALVVAKKHYRTTLDLPNSQAPELMDAIKNTIMILTKQFKADGFNVINNGFKAGGQEVFHVHYHILPRHNGDGKMIFVKND